MDMSSSAPQRSSASDALAIQPGSVRTSTVDAAAEFARHLANNNQTEDTRRRDDRPAERRDRPETRDRSRRDDEIESRKTEDGRDEKTAAVTKDVIAEPLPVQADLPSDGAPSSVDKHESAPVAPPAEDAPSEAENAVPAEGSETEAVAGAPVSSDTRELPKASAETAAPLGARPAQIAPDGVTAEVKPATAKPAAPVDAGKAPVPAEITAAQMPGGQVLEEALNAKPIAVAPKGAIPVSGSQPEVPADGEAAAVPVELEALVGKKPIKGLGHNAAEQLADKKADAKQMSTPSAAAPQTAPGAPQPPRTSGPATQFTLAATPTETGSSRGGDLGVTGTTSSSNGSGNTATVRIGTLPGQSQPTQLPSTAIALQMARNLQKGMSRFDIRLDPPEMGRIDVRMEVRKDGHVVAHMTVDRPETLDLLQRDARALQQALNNAGLQADSDSLNFSLRDQNSDGNEKSFAGSGVSRGGDDVIEETMVAPAYNVNLSATGGIDIRV